MGIFDFFKKSNANKCKECGDIIQSEFEICFDCKNKLKENENGFNNIPTPDGGRVEFNKVNGEVDGYMNVYYPSGEKLSEAIYKNNQPLSFKKFHLNGNISEIANMKNAEITGLLKKYYESGKLAEESYWEKGKQNGEYKYYYENSSIERQGMMRNGEQHGYWKFYYESGKLSEESYWEKGKQNGEYKLYDENGNLNEEGNSKNLKIEADVKQDFSDYTINTIFNSIRKIICEKFDVNTFSKKFNLSEEELDINYWYDIFLQRVEFDDFAAMYKYSKDAPFEEKLSKNIQGHFDTYKQKFGINAVADIYEIMKVRVLMFGFIHKHITKLIEENKIMSSSNDRELYKSGVSRKDIQNQVILHLVHIKASLYSAISFAMSHNISDDYISEWYPEFNDDKDSLKDINADCLSFIYKKSSGEKFDPKETYDEKKEKEAESKEKEWSENYISNQICDRKEIANEYKFMRNLAVKIEELILIKSSWTFKNNGEKRLYNLRYNNSNGEEKLISQISKLEKISKHLGNLLNDYDNLDRDFKFKGYHLLEQVYSRCTQLFMDLKNDMVNNNLDDNNGKKKKVIKDTSFGYTEEKFEIIKGQKNGVLKSFNKKGTLLLTEYYIDDEMLSFIKGSDPD